MPAECLGLHGVRLLATGDQLLTTTAVLRRFLSCDARQHAENFLFLHNQEIFAVNLDFSAGILTEQDVVSLFHRQREHLAVFIAPALAHGDDFALLRLVLSTVWYEDSAASGCCFFYATNQDAVVQRSEFRSHTRKLLIDS